MDFKIGDKVSFLNSTDKGTVVNIPNINRVQVETENGFIENIHPKELVKIDDSIYSNINFKNYKEEVSYKNKSKKNINFSEIKEIDLHIENILDNTIGLSNYDIVQYQLKYAYKEVLKLYSKGIKNIVLIHGKGEGVLRSEIYSFFNKYEIDIEDASYEKYGFKGASIIYVRDIN